VRECCFTVSESVHVQSENGQSHVGADLEEFSFKRKEADRDSNGKIVTTLHQVVVSPFENKSLTQTIH
jgi:hypothetical protein